MRPHPSSRLSLSRLLWLGRTRPLPFRDMARIARENRAERGRGFREERSRNRVCLANASTEGE